MEFILVRNFRNCGFCNFAVYFANIVENVAVHFIQKPKDGSSCNDVFISIINLYAQIVALLCSMMVIVHV